MEKHKRVENKVWLKLWGYSTKEREKRRGAECGSDFSHLMFES